MCHILVVIKIYLLCLHVAVILVLSLFLYFSTLKVRLTYLKFYLNSTSHMFEIILLFIFPLIPLSSAIISLCSECLDLPIQFNLHPLIVFIDSLFTYIVSQFNIVQYSIVLLSYYIIYFIHYFIKAGWCYCYKFIINLKKNCF